MIKIKEYVRAESLEEAWELNQKRTSCIIGGMLWLKMGNRQVRTAIDLSGLGLDTIEETKDAFVIGCMTTLRDLECHEGLDAAFDGMIRESVRNIVGVQFRNLATVGGSVAGKFGFSDVCTCLLALDAEVELYKAGKVSMEAFLKQKKDRDIVVRIHIRKRSGKGLSLSFRNISTDFPVLACGFYEEKESCRIAVGSRPARAAVYETEGAIALGLENGSLSEAEICAEADRLAKVIPVSGNQWGSAPYRAHLLKVLIRRGLMQMNQRGGEKQ